MASSEPLHCPHCHAVLKGSSRLPVGKTIRCLNCGNAFRVEYGEELPLSPPRHASPPGVRDSRSHGGRPRRPYDEGDASPSGSRTGLIVALVGLLALIIGGGSVAGYFLFFKGDAPEQVRNEDDTRPADTKPETTESPQQTKPATSPPPPDTRPKDPPDPPPIFTPPPAGSVGQEVYKYVLKSVVWIYNLTDPRSGKAYTGSGALVDKKHRLVLTNYHVIHEASTLHVLFPILNKDGGLAVTQKADYQRLIQQGKAIKAVVVEHSKMKDLALIQLESLPPEVEVLPLSKEEAAPGQAVHSVGSPGRSDGLFLYTSGTVRQLYRKQWKAGGGNLVLDLDAEVVETQSPTNPGDSGGPLVNDQGEMVAVTQGGSRDASLVSLFINVREARTLINGYIKKVDGADWVADARPPLKRTGSGATASIADLIKLLGHSEAANRTKAALALAEMGNKAQLAIAALVDVVRRDEDLTARIAARDALAKIGPLPKSEVGLLAEWLADNNVDVRRYAAKSLNQLGGDARPALKPLLEATRDKDTQVRQNAALALGKFGPATKAEVTPVLREMLEDPEAAVRVAAVKGLTDLLKPGTEDIPVLLAFLELEDVEARAVAVRCLGKLGPDAKAAVPQLIASNKRADNLLRQAIFETLGQIGPDAREAIPALIDGLKDADKDVKTAALRGLAGMGKEAQSTNPAVASLIGSSDANVRKEALKTIREIGGSSKEMVDAITALLKSPDAGLRQEAMTVIADLGPDARDLVKPLFDLTGTQEKPEDRKVVTDLIVKLGKAAVPALAKALKDDNPYVRASAVVVAYELGPTAKDKDVIDALNLLAQRERIPQIRAAAAEAFKKVSAKP